MREVYRDGNVAVIPCETAAEFLGVLDPLSGMFRHAAETRLFAFRGVPSATYKLLPSAFRKGSLLAEVGGWTDAPLPTVRDQCQAEFFTIRRFFDIAAKHGVRLPEDTQMLRTQLDDWEFRFSRLKPGVALEWPPDEFLSLIALVQHHGLPTRALDWSWNALTATYFALQKPKGRPKELAVWAFSWFAREWERIFSYHDPGGRPLKLFTAPGADNVNLRAQQGLFMVWRQEIADGETPFAVTAYDDLVPSTLRHSRNGPLIFKITLPRSEADAVASAVWSAGVTAGSLFPGLDGVAREVAEKRDWDGALPRIRSTVARDLERAVAALFPRRR